MNAADTAALAAIASMCPRHTPETPPKFDPDCGDCGTRQEAAQIYLVGLVEDVLKAFRL